MCFLVKNKGLLIKYNELWNQVQISIKGKKFHSNLVFDKKYLKAKIKG